MLKNSFFKSWQVCDCLTKWLIMLGFIDLRQPRIVRSSNFGLVFCLLTFSFVPETEQNSRHDHPRSSGAPVLVIVRTTNTVDAARAERPPEALTNFNECLTIDNDSFKTHLGAKINIKINANIAI